MTNNEMKEEFREYTDQLQVALTQVMQDATKLPVEAKIFEDPSGQTRIIIDTDHFTIVADHLVQFEHSELMGTFGAVSGPTGIIPDTTMQTVEYIRIWLPFRNLNKFSFIIRHEHWDDKLLKYLGRQDIDASSEVFNDRFLCQSDDLEGFEFMITKGPLEEMLLRQPEVQFMTDHPGQRLSGAEAKNTSLLQFLSTTTAIDLVCEQMIILLQAYRLLSAYDNSIIGKPDVEIDTGE